MGRDPAYQCYEILDYQSWLTTHRLACKVIIDELQQPYETPTQRAQRVSRVGGSFVILR